jgi:Uma2 family endonuclease
MMTLAPQKHQFNVSEWHKMGKYNIFSPDARMELINGEIIDMAPIGPSHAGCVRNLIELLSSQKGKSALVDVQNPIRLGNTSEPEPDLTLLRPASHFYREKHPTAEDIFLLIEVSDTTVQHDREKKIPLYAKDGIIECWLVDLNEFQVEVYLNPTANGYTNKRILESGETLIPSQLPHINIPVSEILSP